MVTYNHEKYIAQAIESVLMQKASFDYELVIGEDFSTDKTREIVIKYQKKHPNKIKLILNKKNLGMMPNFIQTLKTCKGEYVAMLEGDDYWIDPYKLQKQVDFLSRNPDYSISSHNVYVTQDGRKGQPIEWLGEYHRETSTLEEILRDGSGGATCSLVFRNNIFGEFPKWFVGLPGGDWALQIFCTIHGKMYYFNKVMSVYQRGHPNNALMVATRSVHRKGRETIGLSYEYTLNIINIFDKYFKYRYSNLLKNQVIYCYFNLANLYKQNKEFVKARHYAWRCLKEIFGQHPYLSLEHIINLIKIILLPNNININHLIKKKSTEQKSR